MCEYCRVSQYSVGQLMTIILVSLTGLLLPSAQVQVDTTTYLVVPADQSRCKHSSPVVSALAPPVLLVSCWSPHALVPMMYIVAGPRVSP